MPVLIGRTLLAQLAALACCMLPLATSSAQAGSHLLGGPHEPTCEVVQVETAAPEPDGTRRIRRCLFDTFGGNHRPGRWSPR